MAAFAKFEVVNCYIIKCIHGIMCPVSPMMSTSKSGSGKSPAMSGSYKGILQAWEIHLSRREPQILKGDTI